MISACMDTMDTWHRSCRHASTGSAWAAYSGPDRVPGENMGQKVGPKKGAKKQDAPGHT